MKWRDYAISVPDQPFVSLAEITTWLRVPDATVRRWVREGTFPSPIRGGRWSSVAVGVWMAWQEHRPCIEIPGEAERQEREIERDEFAPFVYFIRAGDKVKIGVAREPSKRLKDLQTSCPDALELLCTIRGDVSVERKYHARFAAHRLRPGGEWFHYSDEIQAFVAKAKGPTT